jgi:hypothetical protein
MITLTGFDVRSFHYLLALFAPVFEEYTPFGDENGFIRTKKTKRGRPRQIQAIDCLGLLLSWTRTRGSLMSLQLVFGMTHTPLGKYLQFARRIILKVLKKHPLAEIKMPTMEKLEEYRQAIHRRHPALPNVWGTMDGLKCLIERPGNEITESRFYNGWKSAHFVTSVLCFVPDGTIPAAFFNVPGCTHDSQVADWGHIYNKLESVYESTGLKFVIDSAFSTANINFLIKSSQDYLTADDGLDTYEEQVDNIAVKRAATSM